jgi:hypothetical protein
MDATYAEVWEANSRELQRKYPLLPDRLKVVRRCHAIAMRRLANSPGWWKDDESVEEVQRLSLEDIKRDFEEHGLKGMVERWAIKKAIELVIVILTVYLREEYGEAIEATAIGAPAPPNLDESCESWAKDADLVLQES